MTWLVATWLVMVPTPGTGQVAGSPPRSERTVFEGGTAGMLKAADAGRMPEALEMFLAIARGARMEPGSGWFHPGRGCYDWKWLATRCDANGDGWVTRREFPGPADLFARLDRDENRLITPEDLDWSDLPASFDEGLAAHQAGGRGGLTAADEPPLGILLRSLFRGDLGSFREGPEVGQMAPDFELRSSAGQERVRLSEHRGKRPVVLIFGNMSCGPFRSRVEALEELHRRYADRVDFLAVYVREAHPIDGWRLSSNDRAGIVLHQPQAWAERACTAILCSRALKITIPMVADELDNRVGHAYSGLPTRLYLIDREGRVAYKSGRGPFGVKPGELEQSLVMLLLDEAAVAARRQVHVVLRRAAEVWGRWSTADRRGDWLGSAWARTLLANLARPTTTVLEVDRSRPSESPGDLREPGDHSGPAAAP
jgi:thiol-disulfide isomerase/thioredoxin